MAYNWTFIGAGNMAASIVGGLTAGGTDGGTIALYDTDAAIAKSLAQRTGAVAATTLSEALPARGVLVAVKPDKVEAVCRALSAELNEGGERPLVVSIAAGVRASDMALWLPTGMAIVRCMPNTPALLGLGASALFANENCSPAHRELASHLLGSVGEVAEVNDETDLDTVTALSGSGPAYFFYLIEQMTAVATRMGLAETVARKLAVQTAYGAAAMAHRGDDTPAQLRTKVTSKGGTTAAALESFESQGFPAMVEQAMQACRRRAQQMGDDFSA